MKKTQTKTEQIAELSIENSILQREILKLRRELADKNIRILEASLILEDVIETYEYEKN